MAFSILLSCNHHCCPSLELPKLKICTHETINSPFLQPLGVFIWLSVSGFDNSCWRNRLPPVPLSLSAVSLLTLPSARRVRWGLWGQVWWVPMSHSCTMSAGYPTVWLRSDTFYLEVTLGPTDFQAQSHKADPVRAFRWQLQVHIVSCASERPEIRGSYSLLLG